jgi:hypothetical protein
VSEHTGRLRRGAGFAAVVLATAGLFWVSRGKWSDAIIDSGREWIVPDALARGDMLYRDVVYWFGPFTPYVHAGFFRLFGSSFRTLVVAGCCGAAGVLAALYLALRQVSDRASSAAWTVLAIPALVFMPQAGGAILGMGYRIWHAAAFALLAVVLGARGSRESSPWIAFASGIAAGLSGLCRTEWGGAAFLSAGLAVAVAARRRPQNRVLLFSPMFGGFLMAFGGTLGFFVARAGWKAAVEDAPVLLFNLPEQTRAHVASIHPSVWAQGAVQMVYGASIWVGAFFLLELLSTPRGISGERAVPLRRLGILLVVLLVCGLLAGVPYGPIFSGAPLLCAGAILAGARAGWQAQGPALAGFGALGVLTSYRRPFFIADGPYVAPPLLFALVCAAGLVSLELARRPPQPRRRLSAFVIGAIAVLAAIAFAGRALQYRSDDRVAIAGTEGMLFARPETARQIEGLARSIRQHTRAGEGLVVFPEGELLNYLSGRPNPIRHKLYLPGYINELNEMEIVTELSLARAGAVVIWPRPASEYGRGFFGQDYGLAVRKWLDTHYERVRWDDVRANPSRAVLEIRKN